MNVDMGDRLVDRMRISQFKVSSLLMVASTTKAGTLENASHRCTASVIRAATTGAGVL
jgi:hypothetical protein